MIPGKEGKQITFNSSTNRRLRRYVTVTELTGDPWYLIDIECLQRKRERMEKKENSWLEGVCEREGEVEGEGEGMEEGRGRGGRRRRR